MVIHRRRTRAWWLAVSLAIVVTASVLAAQLGGDEPFHADAAEHLHGEASVPKLNLFPTTHPPQASAGPPMPPQQSRLFEAVQVHAEDQHLSRERMEAADPVTVPPVPPRAPVDEEPAAPDDPGDFDLPSRGSPL